MVLAHTTTVVAAVQQETHAIPVVFVNVSDPIGAGLVTSLARPGANLTGVLQDERGIVGKWLLMLKEIVPRLERVPLVANPKSPLTSIFWTQHGQRHPRLRSKSYPALSRTPILTSNASLTRSGVYRMVAWS